MKTNSARQPVQSVKDTKPNNRSFSYIYIRPGRSSLLVCATTGREERAAEFTSIMASASEIVLPISTQKHDPAWKHCLMIRSGDRTVLKCMYCLKQFMGGGIHRIKEHLARQKGNASCCAKVPPEVQDAMLSSLESAQARKKKRLKITEEMKKLNPIPTPTNITYPDYAPDVVDLLEESNSKNGKRGRKKKLAKYDNKTPMNNLSVAIRPNSEDVVGAVKISSTSSVSIDKDRVYTAIGKFLYDVGVPLEAVNSVHFQSMLDAISTVSGGASLGEFSYHGFRGPVLEKVLDEVRSQVMFCKQSWSETGCSVLANEHVARTGKTVINLSVYCPKGTVFLKSVDATHIVTAPKTFYDLLKHVVEEIGERNVVQVITNNSETHALAGKKLMEAFPTIFWSPCAFRCVDGILEDISKLESIHEVLENAKSITRFVYNDVLALNMVRKFTSGKDLIPCGETRAALNFITLKSLWGFKEELRAMVRCDEWSAPNKKPGGITVTNLINSSSFWSSCALIVRLVEPLVRLLKFVCSPKRPAMAYVYAGIHQAKETIKKVLVHKNAYMPYLEIINYRWDKQLTRPLHSAGFFLNPLFFDAIRGEVSNEVFSGMLDCVERLVPDLKKQDKIQEELNTYRSETAVNFRRPMAVRTRRTLVPANWWLTHGQICPNLMQLAVRVLSQTCSAKGYDQAYGSLEHGLNQRMNFLEHQRIEDLNFVHQNLRLQHGNQLKCAAFDPISAGNIDKLDDWVLERNATISASWKDIIPPVFDSVPLIPNEDEIETFISELDEATIMGAATFTPGVDFTNEEK